MTERETRPRSATIRVLSAGAVEGVLTRLAREFTLATGVEAALTFNTIAGVRRRLAGGETGDIVIGTTPAVAEMMRDGTAVAGSAVEIGRTLSGLCVRKGAPLPDVSTPEAFKATLLAARAFAYTDPAAGGTSGIYLTGLMQRLGILDRMQAKAVLCVNGEDVVRRVVSGEADLGSTFVSEFGLVDGVASAGPFPAPIGNATSYSAALLSASTDRTAAARLIATIAAPAHRPAWIAGGFERAG